MGHIARATSLTTSLDLRRDGHVLDCSRCPKDAQSGGKEVGMEAEDKRRLSRLRLPARGQMSRQLGDRNADSGLQG